MHLGPYFAYVPYLFPSFLIHVTLLTLYRIRNQVYLSTRNRSTLNTILKGFLKTAQDLVTNLRAHPNLYADLIALLQGVDTQVTSDDPMGIVRKNTANDLRETWRRLSPNMNCWNRKSLHSFRNRERLRTLDCVRLEKATRETLRLYDFVVVTLQLLCMGSTFGALQASQPCANELKDQKARPSDDHVLQRPPDSKATGPLPEEDASIKDKSVGFTNRCPSDLSYMKGRHHLEWHWFRKNGSPDGRRRRDRIHSLELIL